MSTVLTDNSNYTAIANAIRAKGGSGTFQPSQMAAAIAALPSGGGSLGIATITASGNTYNFSNYTTGNNFILFFVDVYNNSTANDFIYSPLLSLSYAGQTYHYGSLLYNTSYRRYYSRFLGESINDQAMYGLNPVTTASYSNGVFTYNNGYGHNLGTSALLVYVA